MQESPYSLILPRPSLDGLSITKANIYIPGSGAGVSACALSRRIACLNKKRRARPPWEGQALLSTKIITTQVKEAFVLLSHRW
jgi:hypothetical protein